MTDASIAQLQKSPPDHGRRERSSFHLTLVRHSDAENFSENGSDFARRLTAAGRNKAQDAATRLKASELVRPCLFYSSSAKRALETAEIFAEVFALPREQILSDRILYDAGALELLQIIRAFDFIEFPDVIFFGHNPTIGDLSSDLCGDYRLFFSPASVLTLQFPGQGQPFLDREKVKKCYFFSP